MTHTCPQSSSAAQPADSFTVSAHPLHELSALDVHQLYKLRVDVFVHEQQCPYAEIDDTDAHPDTLHILARRNGEIVGTARVFPSAHGTGDNAAEFADFGVPAGTPVTQFGRFALHPSVRGAGIGKLIMAEALRLSPGAALDDAAAPAPFYLEAQAGLVGYYGGYGFVPCGEEFDDEGVPHVPMIRTAR